MHTPSDVNASDLSTATAQLDSDDEAFLASSLQHGLVHSDSVEEDGIDGNTARPRVPKAATITDTGVQQAQILERSNASGTADIATQTYYTLMCHGTSILLERDPFAGTGGLLWPAGERLALHLCNLAHQDPSLFSNKRIVELGTGTGVVGIALAKQMTLQGRGRIVMTDLETVLSIVGRNVKLNGCSQAHVSVARLAWGEPLPPAFTQPGSVDVVVMADVIYHDYLFDPLLTTLNDLFAVHPALVCYLGYKKRRRADWVFLTGLRRHFTMTLLKEDAETRGQGLEQVHVQDERWRQGVYLYQLTSKG